MDRRRQPLDGSEIRSCWEAGISASTVPGLPVVAATTRPSLDFVEIGAPSPARPERAAGATIVSQTLPAANEPGWSLWGDPDA